MSNTIPILKIKTPNGEEATIPAIQGKSAYQIAKDNGFEGTEVEWLESLKGKGGENITPSAIGAASTATYNASITTTWSGSAAPYTQTISVPGITVDDNPIVDLKPNSIYGTAVTEMNEFGKIYRITTAANSITVYATQKTTVALPIQLKCIR